MIHLCDFFLIHSYFIYFIIYYRIIRVILASYLLVNVLIGIYFIINFLNFNRQLIDYDIIINIIKLKKEIKKSINQII